MSTAPARIPDTDLDPAVLSAVPVSAGRLDRRVRGWADHIDLTRLDMRLHDLDILGQLAAAVPDRALRGLDQTSAADGFDVPAWTGPLGQAAREAMTARYAALTEAWRIQIMKRRITTSKDER